MGLITGPLDQYDYLTFAFLVVAIVGFFYVLIAIGGLPGKLAERRHHPHAESVKLMGWIGLFTVFPWVHALIWAYHDSLTIDVRKFPGKPGEEPDKPAEQPVPEPEVSTPADGTSQKTAEPS